MNRLDRFRFGKVHKRRVFSMFMVVVAIFVLSLLILAALGIFGIRSEVPRMRIYSQGSGRELSGVGLDLDSMPTSNRIAGGGFEDGRDYTILTVRDAVGQYIYFSPEEIPSEDTGFIDNDIKIMSLDSDGIMSLRFKSTVTGFDDAGFGNVAKIEDVGGYWMNDPVVDTAYTGNVLDAVTESGKLIIDITSEQLIKEYEDPDCVVIDIEGTDDGVYALTQSGEIIFAQDGRNFTAVSQIPEQYEAVSFAPGPGAPVVITTSGEILYAGTGEPVAVDAVFGGKASLIAGDGSRIAVLSSDGDVYISENGLVYSYLGSISPNSEGVDLLVSGEKVYCLNNLGRVDILSGSGSYTTDISAIEPVSFTLGRDGYLIAVTSDGKACLVSESGGKIIDLNNAGGVVDGVFAGPEGKTVTKMGNNIYISTVLSAVKVSDEISEDLIMDGDICIISSDSADISSWATYGEGTTLSASGSEAVLTGEGDNDHIMSQKLYGNATDDFTGDSFYRISLRLRAEGIPDGKAVVWINGQEFGSVGFTATDLTDKYEERSFVFAVTENMLSEQDNQYFNISFEGTGTLYVDDIYVGEDRYDADYVPNDFVKGIEDSTPSALRFDYLGLGNDGFRPEVFYGSGTESLERSLELSASSGAAPWLEIGPLADKDDVDDLLDYICGSVSSVNGKKRIDNGTALPWSRQFDTIYIEINDDEGIYSSDAQRGAYVSYIVEAVNRSPYYAEIKDRIVILDGMDYEGGTVLGSADYHASGFDLRISSAYRGSLLSQAEERYWDFSYELPRMASRSADAGEFISGLRFDLPEERALSCGELAAILTNRNASNIRLTMVDLPLSARPSDTESRDVFSAEGELPLLKVLPALSHMRYTDGVYYEIQDPLDQNSENTADNFNNACTTLVVEDSEYISIIVSNSSSSPVQFITEGLDFSPAGAEVIRYSSSGDLLSRREIGGNIRHTLQGGEVRVIRISKS